MSTIRSVIDNTIDVIEGTTPDTTYANAPRFQHVDRVYAAADLADTESPTRRFTLVPAGDRETDGEALQETEPFRVQQTFDLVMLYRQGTNALELIKVVLEDVERLSLRLMTTTLWDADNTRIWRRLVNGYDLEPDEDPNGTAVLTLPIVICYTPVLS